MLRKMQVEIVDEFMEDARTACDLARDGSNGSHVRDTFVHKSAVKQMIMGAGV